MTDDRAEQAFRTALAARAAAYEPAPGPVPAPRRPRRWPALAAVAALVVAVALAGIALRPSGHRGAAPPAALPQGWRWESHADVMVAVPGSWGYAHAPDDQWCTVWDENGTPRPGQTSRLPGQGYVDTTLPGDVSTAVLCSGGNTPPTSLFVVHLTFLGTEHPAPVPPGWQNASRLVGGQRLNVVTDGQHRSLADRILATAHVVREDENGCAVSSPIQNPSVGRPSPPFDVATLTGVDSIAVCQYRLGVTGPGLVASQQLTGAAADAELAALRAAPTDGGPDRATGCSAADRGPTGITLLLRSGGRTHEMYAFYSGCTGNGFDDGTHVRALTRAACPALFGPRIIDSEGIRAAFERCSPPARR